MIEAAYAEDVLHKLISTWSGPDADMRGILDLATAEIGRSASSPR